MHTDSDQLTYQLVIQSMYILDTLISKPHVGTQHNRALGLYTAPNLWVYGKVQITIKITFMTLAAPLFDIIYNTVTLFGI